MNVRRILLIGILILVFGWVTAEKWAVRSALGAGPQITQFVVLAEGLKDFEVAALKEGDAVYRKNQLTQLFGKIVGVDVAKARMITVNQETGETLVNEVPERYDVFLTIESTAVKSPLGNTLVNNGQVYFNQYLPLFTTHASIETRVVNIDHKGE